MTARMIAGVLALALAGCQTAAEQAQRPGDAPLTRDQPGTTVRIHNIDPTRWDVQARAEGTVYVCKPLACVAPSQVFIQTRRAPTRNPDPAALARVAKLAPAQIQSQNVLTMAGSDGASKIESLASRSTQLRGYPAIVVESRRSYLGQPTSYLHQANIFMGIIEVRVASLSGDRDAARRNLQAFVDGIEVTDVPPA